MSILTKLITASVMLIMAQMSFATGDVAAGKAKSATCTVCHGTNGIGNYELWPNLAGQKQGYLIKAIKDFRDGTRFDPTMAPTVKPLSDQDIEDLAAYYSSLE